MGRLLRSLSRRNKWRPQYRLRLEGGRCLTYYEVGQHGDPEVGQRRWRRQKKNLQLDVKYKLQMYIATWRKKTPGSDLTVDYLLNLWNTQDGKCYYTGKPMLWKSAGIASESMSLDRLDPDKGYVQGNVVWCCLFVNVMKGHLTEQGFYGMMRHILAYRKGDS